MKMECLTIVDLGRRRFRRLIDPTPFAATALAVAFGAFETEHVQLALDVAEDEIGAGRG
jgi:hypothetical protein